MVAAAAFEDADGAGVAFGEAGSDQLLRIGFDRLFAEIADAAHQTLGEHQVHRGGHQEGFDAHVHQTVDGRRCVVGVQRRQHEVAGERGFDRHFGGFEVADLADQDDVRILAQERTQGRREVEADRFLHLHLVDAGQIEFDRVFGGHDVGFGRVEVRKCGIKRVGFARTGRAGHQHHAVGPVDGGLEFAQRFDLEAELGHVQHQLVFVEQPEHDFFAEKGGEHRDAVVELLLLVVDLGFDLDAAVLRQPFFGDVELRHDLHARSDGFAQAQRRVHHLVEDAVDAVPDAVLLFVGLDVDVGGAAFDGVGEDDVHQAHHGRLVRLLFEGVDIKFFGLVVEHLEIATAPAGTVVEVFHDLLQLEGVGRAVVAVDRRTDLRLGGEHRLDRVTGHELDVVHREHVGRVQHRDGDFGAGFRHRHDRVFAGNVGRDDLDDRLVDLDLAEVDGRNLEVFRQGLDQLGLADDAHLDQIGPDAAAFFFLPRQRRPELIRGDFAGLDEHLAQSIHEASLRESSLPIVEPGFREAPRRVPDRLQFIRFYTRARFPASG